MSNRFTKDPDAKKTYTINYGTNYLSTGVTISNSTWTVPTGITKESVDATNFDDTTATIQVSGGTAGTTYRCVNAITMSDGDIDNRSIFVHVEER